MKVSFPRKHNKTPDEIKENTWTKLQELAETPTMKFLNKYSLAFHGLLACILVFVIEWMSRHSFASAWNFMTETPLTFLYNALLIFATLMIVYVFKRRVIIRVAVSVFWILLGIINGCVLANRVTPFNFTDLKMVSDLLTMTNSKYFTKGEEIAVVCLLIGIACFLVYFGIRGPKFPGVLHRVRNIICLAGCIAIIPFVTKMAINSDILAGYFGNLAQGYEEYGFVYSFSSSVLDTGMSHPADYSEEAVTAIEDEVNQEETAVSDTEDMPNIIFVQLETFVDPDEFNFLSYSEDPTPNFHNLMNNYSSGYLTVPVVGAGTANTEFEVLTGMSIHFFGLGEYPYKTVMKDTAVESAADDLSDLGYSTHALHNNGGNFYSRAKVFSQMGFDSYTSKELMDITEYNEIDSWPTDEILVDETTKILDSTENQSDFLYTITVQSHGSYPDYQVFEDPEIEVTGGDTTQEHYQYEYYINELHEVDNMIGDLIDTLSQRDEKTIVVLYGDHLPTLDLENDDMKSGSIYNTKYVTWNNFGLEKSDADVTAYQLFARITDQLGIHQGTMFRYHQAALNNGTTDSQEYVDNLELLQYDLLYGNRYVYGGQNLYPASDLVMGTQDVVITDTEVNTEDHTLVITGENFTPWSKVTVNGTLVDTTYVSGTCVTVPLDAVSDGDTIAVNQVGSSETIFRSSNSVILEGINPDREEAAPAEDTDSKLSGTATTVLPADQALDDLQTNEEEQVQNAESDANTVPNEATDSEVTETDPNE